MMPNFKDAALNIATLGYHGYRRSLQLEAELKDLRTKAGTSSYDSGGSVQIVNIKDGSYGDKPARKLNPKQLREYAERNPWLRSAIDIYRDIAGNAEWRIEPVDRDKKMDQGVAREVEQLLQQPNELGQPYAELKEEFIEDYLVLGIGAMEMGIRRDLTPYGLYEIDAANFAIFTKWNGDLKKPHYAEVNTVGDPTKLFLDPQAMVLVNRKGTSRKLGLSHVESLVRSVSALLDGDEFLISQVLSTSPKGLLHLGENVTPQQVAEARARIQNSSYPFVVTGGTKAPQYMPLSLSPEQLKVLDAQAWFVREIATIFKIPTAMLQLAVDTSRANTEAMLQMAEAVGLANLIWRICYLENARLVLPYGPFSKHNVRIGYPILSAKDASKQTEITRLSMGGKSWKTPNEARIENGLAPIDEPIYNQIIWDDGKNGPIPLEALQARYYEDNGKLKEVVETDPNADPGAAPEPNQPDGQEGPEQEPTDEGQGQDDEQQPSDDKSGKNGKGKWRKAQRRR
jgi:hypothetical protein